MHQQPHNPNQHACNCRCPIHHSMPRLLFTDPGYRCTIDYSH